MKKQPVPGMISDNETPRSGTASPLPFSEAELLEELAKGAPVCPSGGPEISLSPEIAPQEFESVYLWFFS